MDIVRYSSSAMAGAHAAASAQQVSRSAGTPAAAAAAPTPAPALAPASSAGKPKHARTDSAWARLQAAASSAGKQAATSERARRQAREAACGELLLRRFPCLGGATRAAFAALLRTTRTRTYSSRPATALDRQTNVLVREGEHFPSVEGQDPCLLLIASGSVDVFMRSPFMDASRTKHPDVLVARLRAGDEMNALAVCSTPVEVAEREYSAKKISYTASPYTLVVSQNSEFKEEEREAARARQEEMEREREKEREKEVEAHTERRAATTTAGSGAAASQHSHSARGHPAAAPPSLLVPPPNPFQKLYVYAISLQAFRNLLCSAPMLYELVQSDLFTRRDWRIERMHRNAMSHTSIGGYSADRTPFGTVASGGILPTGTPRSPQRTSNSRSGTEVSASLLRARSPVRKRDGVGAAGEILLHSAHKPTRFTHTDLREPVKSTSGKGVGTGTGAGAAGGRVAGLAPDSALARILSSPPPPTPDEIALMKPPGDFAFDALMGGGDDKDKKGAANEEEKEKQRRAQSKHQADLLALASSLSGSHARSSVRLTTSSQGAAAVAPNPAAASLDLMAVDADAQLLDSMVAAAGGGERVLSPEETQMRRSLSRTRAGRAAAAAALALAESTRAQKIEEEERYKSDLALVVRKALAKGLSVPTAPPSAATTPRSGTSRRPSGILSPLATQGDGGLVGVGSLEGEFKGVMQLPLPHTSGGTSQRRRRNGGVQQVDGVKSEEEQKQQQQQQQQQGTPSYASPTSLVRPSPHRSSLPLRIPSPEVTDHPIDGADASSQPESPFPTLSVNIISAEGDASEVPTVTFSPEEDQHSPPSSVSVWPNHPAPFASANRDEIRFNAAPKSPLIEVSLATPLEHSPPVGHVPCSVSISIPFFPSRCPSPSPDAAEADDAGVTSGDEAAGGSAYGILASPTSSGAAGGRPNALDAFENDAAVMLARTQARLAHQARLERKAAQSGANARIHALRAAQGRGDISGHGSALPSTDRAQRIQDAPVRRSLLEANGLITRRFARTTPSQLFTASSSFASLKNSSSNALAHASILRMNAAEIPERMSSARLAELKAAQALKYTKEKRKQSSILVHPPSSSPQGTSGGREGGAAEDGEASITSDLLESLFHLGDSSVTEAGHGSGAFGSGGGSGGGLKLAPLFRATPSIPDDPLAVAAATATPGTPLSPLGAPFVSKRGSIRIPLTEREREEAPASLLRLSPAQSKRSLSSVPSPTQGPLPSPIPLFTTPTRNSSGLVLSNSEPGGLSYGEFFNGGLNQPPERSVATAQALRAAPVGDREAGRTLGVEVSKRMKGAVGSGGAVGEVDVEKLSEVLVGLRNHTADASTISGPVSSNASSSSSPSPSPSRRLSRRTLQAPLNSELSRSPLNLLGFVVASPKHVVAPSVAPETNQVGGSGANAGGGLVRPGLSRAASTVSVPGLTSGPGSPLAQKQVSFSFGDAMPTRLVAMTEEQLAAAAAAAAAASPSNSTSPLIAAPRTLAEGEEGPSTSPSRRSSLLPLGKRSSGHWGSGSGPLSPANRARMFAEAVKEDGEREEKEEMVAGVETTVDSMTAEAGTKGTSTQLSAATSDPSLVQTKRAAPTSSASTSVLPVVASVSSSRSPRPVSARPLRLQDVPLSSTLAQMGAVGRPVTLSSAGARGVKHAQQPDAARAQELAPTETMDEKAASEVREESETDRTEEETSKRHTTRRGTIALRGSRDPIAEDSSESSTPRLSPGAVASVSRFSPHTLHPWNATDWRRLRAKVRSVALASRQQAAVTLSDIFYFQGLEDDPAAIQSGLGLEQTVGTRATNVLDLRSVVAGLGATPSTGIYALSIILKSLNREHPMFGTRARRFELKKESSGRTQEELNKRMLREQKEAREAKIRRARPPSPPPSTKVPTQEEEEAELDELLSDVRLEPTPAPEAAQVPLELLLSSAPHGVINEATAIANEEASVADVEARRFRRSSMRLSLAQMRRSSALSAVEEDATDGLGHDDMTAALTFLTLADPSLIETALSQYNFFGIPPGAHDGDADEAGAAPANATAHTQPITPPTSQSVSSAAPAPSHSQRSMLRISVARANAEREATAAEQGVSESSWATDGQSQLHSVRPHDESKEDLSAASDRPILDMQQPLTRPSEWQLCEPPPEVAAPIHLAPVRVKGSYRVAAEVETPVGTMGPTRSQIMRAHSQTHLQPSAAESQDASTRLRHGGNSAPHAVATSSGLHASASMAHLPSRTSASQVSPAPQRHPVSHTLSASASTPHVRAPYSSRSSSQLREAQAAAASFVAASRAGAPMGVKDHAWVQVQPRAVRAVSGGVRMDAQGCPVLQWAAASSGAPSSPAQPVHAGRSASASKARMGRLG